MSDTDVAPIGAEADELLAIELALGLLEPAERAAAERRLEEDPPFAALHARWHARALALLEGREERPPKRVWNGIARRLPANDAGHGVRRWQAATAVAASVALALGATLAFRREAPAPVSVTPPAPSRSLVAVLASPERDDVVAVSIDPARQVATALPRQLSTGGREAQLWVIPAGGKPVAAGLLLPGGRTSLVAEPGIAALMVPGATLAISLEPRGGSPTGAPTGPVILTGTIARS
jgi:anti-sigma-K factor RskA